MKQIIKFIRKSINGDINGRLVNIQQHSDGVVNEFAISYEVDTQEKTKQYERYFVIKPADPSFPLFFMGNDTTALDPKTNPYFLPTKQLDKNKNTEEFWKVANAINENEEKSYSIDNIISLWISPYPEGEYSISYLD